MKVLQYSGGKDSLACLYLLREEWPEMTVMWVNSGAAFPETLEHMARIRELVPHFYEVVSSQNIEAAGYPVDLLPVSYSQEWSPISGKPPKFQSRFSCCAFALWRPMGEAIRKLGATEVIRGTKRCDGFKMIKEAAGITYRYPIETWTDADVYKFLDENGIEMPRNYRTMNTGLDCWNCTAYMSNQWPRLDYMSTHHPAKYDFVISKLAELKSAITEDFTFLERVL